MNSSRPRAGLRQDEKSAATQRRLLDAAIACLVEKGYAGTSGSEVAELAGLSRGARLYHFPTREEFLLKAADRLFQRIFDEMRQKAALLPSQADRRSFAIDLLWETMSGPLYRAWLELAVASRTEEFLRGSVRKVNEQLMAYVSEFCEGLFVPAGPDIPRLDLFPVMVVLMMRGLAIDAEAADSRDIAQILAALKRTCASLFGTDPQAH
jgi:AcrR family transcriptional regulator